MYAIFARDGVHPGRGYFGYDFLLNIFCERIISLSSHEELYNKVINVMNRKKTISAVAAALLLFGAGGAFAQNDVEKQIFYYTVDVSANPAFLSAGKELDGKRASSSSLMYGYNAQAEIVFNIDGKADFGLFCSGAVYDDRSRGEGLLSSMASVKFGLGLHHPIHSKGNHRIYWTQNLGAVYGHFNYDELELTDLPEGILIPESRWGVNVEEAVRYNYILSSGCGLGFKCFLDVSAFVGKSDEPMLYKPDVLTELGMAFSISF